MADEATLSIQQAEQVDHQLVRGIGIPALTANIVSSTIGAGIFVIPATVAKGLGPAAPLAFVCCAIAMVLFVTCFAIAGSRVSLTGGLYAYVEVAFGRYVGFLAGMLYFLTALGAVAGVVNVLANSVALVVPFLGGPVMRIVVMLAVYGSLVFINIRGVREGAGAVTVITVAKLLPLLAVHLRGNFFYSPAESHLDRLARQQVVRRRRYPVDFRLRRNRGGVDSERRSEKSGAHGSALGLSRACHYDDHLHHDPTRGAGNARRRSCEPSRRAPRRIRREISRQFRPHDSAGWSDHLRIWICHQRHPEFAAHDLCFRPRRRVAAVFRARSSALSIARRRDHHLRHARVCPVHQRHIRKTGGAFQRRGSVDVSALLRRLLGFGATRCARRWRSALQFSWNENCARAGDRRDHLDSYTIRHKRKSTGSDTRAGLRLAALVLAGASIFYIVWKSFMRSRPEHS